MDLRALNTFIHVAESGSFTRAAEQLGYAQPTISIQIKQLETELGLRLFDRIGHTIRLTDKGRDVLAYAQEICRLCLVMTQESREQPQVQGTVRLAMADSLCTPLFLRGFADFRRRYPQISLVVTTAGTGTLFDLLDHNEVDIVCTLDEHIYDASYVIAGEERVGVHFVAAAGHPLAGRQDLQLTELLAQPFLLTEKGMSYRRLLDTALARHSLEIQPVLEMGSADLLCELVSRGMGLSFLPDYVTQRAVAQGRVVRLAVRDVTPELWKQVLYHRDKWVSPLLRATLEHLAAQQLGEA